MPFKSKSQERFFFAAQKRGDLKPGTAEKWAHETPDIKALPEHVGRYGRGHKPKEKEPPKGGSYRTRA